MHNEKRAICAMEKAQYAYAKTQGRASAWQDSNSDDIPILYGGSVKPENASKILALPHVGGALVGGASLNPKDFLAIINKTSGELE